ncbi:MAG: oxalate/formate MFS antiporter [Rhodomicrobium sp.]
MDKIVYASRAAPAECSQLGSARWAQLILGVVCMAMIANLQYGWTLFVNPIAAKHHFDKHALQYAFTIFVIFETWLVPFKGYAVDKLGPRMPVVIGGVLVGISWVMNAYATSLDRFYLAAAIGGIGAAAVYGTCVGNALKWFPDRRGLAAGLTAMGFGAGSALTISPIYNMIQSPSYGYESAFYYFGIGQGLVIFFLGWFLRSPDRAALEARYPAPAKAPAGRRQFAPLEIVQTPLFWVMYAMFVMMAAGGLMAVAQLAPIAADFSVADKPVSLAGIVLAALPFALTLDRIVNGISRPFFGWVSDIIGRETTMVLAFAAEGAGIVCLGLYGQDPIWFVILSGLVFFAWGEIYSLFPATCGDAFGSKYAAANAGILYTAKGAAALLVPYTSLLSAEYGWRGVFYAAASLNFAAALLAAVALRPLRRRFAARNEQALGMTERAALA